MSDDEVTIEEAREHFAHFMGLLATHVASQGATIPCRAGCAGCCRGEVGVFDEERASILAAVPQAAYERLEAQGPTADPHTSVCPLLDPETQRCTIYAVRPLVCRSYAVVGDPDVCFPEKVPGGEPAILWDPVRFLADMAERPPETNLRDLLASHGGDNAES